LFGKLPIAGRGEQLPIAVGEDLQANGIERPHLAFGLSHLALRGLQTSDCGEALELLFDVILNPG
jgi:hypothetical protein